MKLRTKQTVPALAIVLAALAVAASCSSPSPSSSAAANPEGSCAPGQQTSCACPGGASGAQTCNQDGKGFSACLGCPSSTEDGSMPLDATILDGSSDSGDDATDSGHVEDSAADDANSASDSAQLTDSSTSDAATSCEADASDCLSNVPRTCVGGSWVSQSPCTGSTPMCSAGTCVECAPNGAVSCGANTPRTCTGNHWQYGTACSGGNAVCLDGNCVQCSPNATQCGDSTTLQTCDDTGHWVNSTTCQYTCSAGACAGECSPSAIRCNGSTIQTCANNYHWNDQTNCPYGCQSGACLCNPGARQCFGNTPQQCDSTGHWQNDICNGATPYCGGAGQCVQCTQASQCPSPSNGSATCLNYQCGFTCNAGFTPSGNTCVSLYCPAATKYFNEYKSAGLPNSGSSECLDNRGCGGGTCCCVIDNWDNPTTCATLSSGSGYCVAYP